MSEAHTVLPATKQPYLLRDHEGEHYLIGTQLVTVIASAASSGGLFELVSLTGCLGDGFPAHRHSRAHEGIYVQEGLVGELDLKIVGPPPDGSGGPGGPPGGH